MYSEDALLSDISFSSKLPTNHIRANDSLLLFRLIPFISFTYVPGEEIW
jgi:hypothetical protein